MTANGTSVRELNWDRWEQLARVTNGAAAPCFQCGACTAACPWGLVRAESLNLRKVLHRIQLGLEAPPDDLWRCTTCAACETLCPRGVPVAEVVLSLRQLSWRDRTVPKGLSPVLWDLHWDGNPWGGPPSRRSDWAKGLPIKRFEPSDEALYYVGCTASYDPRLRKVARAIAETLLASGVAFGTLGDDEPCCGDPAHSLGQLDYLALMVEQNSHTFREAGVSRLVTTSPHCFDMFRNHYPTLHGATEVLHYTQYLLQLQQEGRLRLERPVPLKVTFHDPCYLGRRNDEYEAPRHLLQSIPGLELVEMDENRASGLCCGGGGGRIWQETPAGERFAELRVAQAVQTGATILATACPHCVSCLEDAARGAGDLKVMDIAEIVRLAVAPAAKTTVTGAQRDRAPLLS